MKNPILIIIFTILLIGTQLQAGNTTVKLSDFEKNKIYVKGFELFQDGTVYINALGAGETIPHNKINNYHLDPSGMFTYAWIINSETRELIWKMDMDNTKKAGQGYLRKFEDEVKLPKGKYEVYFSTATSSIIFKKGYFSFGDIIDYIFEGKSWYEEGLKKWYVEVRNVDEAYDTVELKKFWKDIVKNTIVSVTDIQLNTFKEYKFQVKSTIPIRIYAIGEGLDGKMYDYSLIKRLEDGTIFWEMKEWDTDHAGGALKNRIFNKAMDIEKGDYVLQVFSDDSHYPEKWNANPPYDPYFYGVTLFIENPEDKKYISSIKERRIEPAIALTKVGNNEYREKIFKVKEPTKFRVLALGEGSSGKMYDYAWLDDVTEDTRIWQMKYNETKHAGGANKNRICEKYITLKPGVYKLGYRSDDSHSASGWNATPPYNPTLWGVTLYPMRGNTVELLDEADLPKMEAKWDIRIVNVGDDVHRFKKFDVTKLSKISIYAIGEGDDGEMYDYGWIENMETGKIEWKMLYENTEWAGGAGKNRKIKDQVYLPPGIYTLHFKTDGSHSAEGWNSAPPEDERSYGISIKITAVK